jgi:hypothetical protein
MLLSPVEAKWKKQQQQQQRDHDGGGEDNIEHQELPKTSVDHSACLIRHAGRAFIRGRFRRVWRPRYLELWDNGLVRYFELPLSTTTAMTTTNENNSELQPIEERADNNTNHNSTAPLRFPKATLRIFHARILDVTTFRDMQVGLPHGSYGFLFHAQREFEDAVAKAAVSPRRRNSHDPIQSHNALSACHPTELAMMTPRDYMCAVDTLEEAQAWVVALQWAALQESNWSSGANTPLERGWSFDSCDQVTMMEPTREQTANHDDDNDVTTTTTTSAATTSNNSPSTNKFETPSSLHDAATHNRLGKIVITKCRRYRWVRVLSGAGQEPVWDVAYEIDMLLLVKIRRARSRRKKRTPPDGTNDDGATGDNQNAKNAALDSWTVQEWSLLRTASDVELLLENLTAELGSAVATTNNSTQIAGFASATLDHLHRQIQTLPYCRQAKQNFRNKRLVSHGSIQKSLGVVDSILRTLALEAVVVNSRAMKAFWGLLPFEFQQHQANTCKGSNLKQSRRVLVWEIHVGTAVMAKQFAWTIPPRYTMETFVKNWLQEEGFTNKSKSHHPTWWNYQLARIVVSILSTRYLVPCLVGIAAILTLIPIWSVSQRYVRMVVTLRMDILLLSYAMAVRFGAWWSKGSQRQNIDWKRIQQSNNAVVASSTVVEVVGATTAAADLDDTSEVLVDDASSTSIESFDLAVASGVVDETIVMQTYPSPYGGGPYRLSPRRSSPLPKYDPTQPLLCSSCWSKPEDEIFRVRGETYLKDRIKIPSSQSAFVCRGVDVWITDNPERHIARHPNVLGGRLAQADTFLVNFLLPFANFVAYFSVPPLSEFPNEKLAKVWSNFLQGDQQYRDARLKLLPVVVEGPWIVKAAVGPGTSPALLGKVIPLQYFFREPEGERRGVYEVDVIITASTIAKGILSVVKGHTKSLTIAFAFIVEAAQQEELPETVLCAFQVHSLHLEDCPILPTCNLDDIDA